jgi:hypothetical protein
VSAPVAAVDAVPTRDTIWVAAVVPVAETVMGSHVVGLPDAKVDPDPGTDTDEAGVPAAVADVLPIPVEETKTWGWMASVTVAIPDPNADAP